MSGDQVAVRRADSSGCTERAGVRRREHDLRHPLRATRGLTGRQSACSARKLQPRRQQLGPWYACQGSVPQGLPVFEALYAASYAAQHEAVMSPNVTLRSPSVSTLVHSGVGCVGRPTAALCNAWLVVCMLHALGYAQFGHRDRNPTDALRVGRSEPILQGHKIGAWTYGVQRSKSHASHSRTMITTCIKSHMSKKHPHPSAQPNLTRSHYSRPSKTHFRLVSRDSVTPSRLYRSRSPGLSSSTGAESKCFRRSAKKRLSAYRCQLCMSSASLKPSERSPAPDCSAPSTPAGKAGPSPHPPNHSRIRISGQRGLMDRRDKPPRGSTAPRQASQAGLLTFLRFFQQNRISISLPTGARSQSVWTRRGNAGYVLAD